MRNSTQLLIIIALSCPLIIASPHLYAQKILTRGLPPAAILEKFRQKVEERARKEKKNLEKSRTLAKKKHALILENQEAQRLREREERKNIRERQEQEARERAAAEIKPNTQSSPIYIGKQGENTSCYIAGLANLSAKTTLEPLTDNEGYIVTWNQRTGQLGYASSSKNISDEALPSSLRYKHDITTLQTAPDYDLELMKQTLSLNPSYFIYNNDKTNKQTIGLIAEEVAPKFPEVVVFDAEGRPDSINYGSINALLIHTIKQLDLKDSQQQDRIDSMIKLLEELFKKLDRYKALRDVINELSPDEINELYNIIQTQEER